MEREEIVEKFAEFLKEYYYNDLVSAASEGKKSLLIDFSVLDKFNPELADYLLESPEEVLAAAEDSLKQIDLPGSVKLRIRVFNLPEEKQIRIRNIRAEHIGKLISVDGMVKRASDIRPEVSEAIFQCPECGAKITVIQTERFIRPPNECECGNRKNFKFVDQKLYDARWVTIEEPFEITSGERPSEIMVFLKEDLTSPKMQNKTDPGNRIKVVGVLKQIPRRVKGTRSRQLEIYIDANSVESVEVEWEELEITPEDEKKILELARDPEIYSKLVASIAPSLYGLDEIKEAIALQLFGGETHVQKDKSRVRGEIHILLVGDPSTAKSALMKVVAGLIPRGRYVSGKGVTGAGLTATVVRDEEFLGGWVLEAGALVMCNRSLICLCPGTRIPVNGKIVEIDKLFDSLKFEKAKCGPNLIDVSHIKGIVPSFDLNSLKTDLYNSKFIGRRKYSGEILNLRFKSGFSLRLTPDHELIDGNKLVWKKAKDFSQGDLVVAPLKLPSMKSDIYIFDLIPDSWKVCLDKNEKKLIKEKILEKYKSIAEFNKKFGINKHVFSGGNQLSLKKFKEIATDLGILDKWRKKQLKYGRKNSNKKIKITKVTPELGYILGFIFGDGYLERKEGHGGVSVNQSIKHGKYIKAFVRCWKKVFREKPHMREFKTRSNLNGRRIESLAKNIYYGSNLLVILYDALVGKSLENILSLPDDVLKGFIAGAFDSDGCISIKKKKRYKVVHVEFLLSNKENVNLNFMLALRRFDIYSRLVKSKSKVGIIRITGRKDVINLKNAIKNYSEKIKIEIPKRINKVSSSSDKLPSFIVAEICKEIINQINTSILNKLGISSIVYDYRNLKYQPSRDQLLKIIRRCDQFLNAETKEKIQKMLKRDFLLDEIIEIKKENYDGFVYDLYVPETNNFVANGVFVHNCIDEFEKIEKTDQIALHEAMEQNTISIAKASIVATLPAQTSILAGGNPKLGRFDPYLPIKEQVDVPETLLSRFDLKFALRDIPNPELDAKVADHILKSRHYGEEEIKPAIEADLLKKYIAYTRKNCHPKLSKEAGEEIKNFFVSLREKVGAEEAAVPITLRQYEALIRLAEASAKVQLRDTVTREDAIRAINLMKASLREFGFEAETGRFDVDRLEGRTTASERGKIRIVLDIIEELTKTIGNTIPKEDVIKAAKDRGLKEFDVEKILNELKNKGDLFEPKVGFLQKM